MSEPVADNLSPQPALRWRELCPWLIIFRALPVACSMTVVLLALIAAVLTPVGWFASEKIFVSAEMLSDGSGLDQEVKINRSPYQPVFPDQPVHWSAISIFGHNLHGLDLIFVHHTNPVRQMTSIDSGWRRFAYFGFGWLWTVIVWSFFGTAICRVAAIKLGRGESIGLDDAFDFSISKFFTTFSAILLPIFGIILLLIPLGLLGLLLKLDIGVVLLGAIWFIVLIFGLLIAILFLGLMFAWPLMVASVSTEGQDSFDAMSRTFSYTFRRPVHYLFYIVVAMIFGGVVWFVAAQFTDGVVHLGHWGTSFGADIGVDRMEVIQSDSVEDIVEQPSGSLQLGRTLIRFWNGLARTVGAAFFHGFFWCVATSIYLLLRKDMDRIDMDEVFVEDPYDAEELPELNVDEDGIPAIDDPEKTVVDRPNDSTNNQSDNQSDSD